MNTTPNGFGLGYIPDAPDDRDHQYKTGYTPYQFVDLEDEFTPEVWDQGQLGSCTAHGSLAAFLYASNKAGVGDPMLSRLELYYNTRELEGTVDEDSGGMIRDAIKACSTGVAPETDWPYDISRFTEQPPSVAVHDSADNIALEYQSVGTDKNAIQSCLSEGFPVVIGVTLYDSFESNESISSGIAPMPNFTEQPIGGHCMAIWGIGTGADWKKVGQFSAADDSTVYAKVRNSWGSGVYQRGYLLIPIEYFSNYGSDFWTIRRVS